MYNQQNNLMSIENSFSGMEDLFPNTSTTRVQSTNPYADATNNYTQSINYTNALPSVLARCLKSYYVTFIPELAEALHSSGKNTAYLTELYDFVDKNRDTRIFKDTIANNLGKCKILNNRLASALNVAKGNNNTLNNCIRNDEDISEGVLSRQLDDLCRSYDIFKDEIYAQNLAISNVTNNCKHNIENFDSRFINNLRNNVNHNVGKINGIANGLATIDSANFTNISTLNDRTNRWIATTYGYNPHDADRIINNGLKIVRLSNNIMKDLDKIRKRNQQSSHSAQRPISYPRQFANPQTNTRTY